MIYWFGHSWGAEFNTDEQRVAVPAGERCVECNQKFVLSDRGVLTPCSVRIWDSFDVDAPHVRVRVCGYHLRCWLDQVVGGEMSHRVLERFPDEKTRHELQKEGEESVGEVGGWRRGQQNEDDVEDAGE